MEKRKTICVLLLFPVFPAVNQSIAGVFQVSYLNDLHQPSYGFNASEARRLCLFLGVTIASKAQVQEALRRGLETCRFGWTDEHLAVIPRIKPLTVCGQNQIGLVTWRATVTHPFDAFCFNESGMTFSILSFLLFKKKNITRKVALITSTCALLLVAVIFVVYLKL
uniref:Lymphatic vessel endothelial hyaluronic receptor 1a n=1 Tax=Mastacembelus armatus TaxID=205130 RepID=A0A7N8X9M1_9TELE